MKTPVLFVVAVSFVLLVGCGAPQADWRELAATRQADRLNTMKSQALKLEHGMTREQVKLLLGQPESVAGSVCGDGTPGGPWNCLTWAYTSINGFAPYFITHTICLIFENRNSEWVLNSWQWHEY